MTCSSCTDLCQDVRIGSPGQLDKTIRVIRDNLADGTLIETPRGSTQHDVIEPTPFAGIVDAATLPDVIKCDFECADCGEAFRLRCETYHGSGGAWTHGTVA